MALCCNRRCLLFKKDYENALLTFKHCEANEGGLNPFVWLRIGECYFELEDINNARDYLIKVNQINKLDVLG